MHPELEILLQLQDLKSQCRELTEIEHERTVESEEFNLDVESAVGELRQKISEMETELTPPVRRRYDRIKAARPRVVVPVINGTCYGCFVSVPTSHTSDRSNNQALDACENCGRFIYFLA